MFFCGFVVVVSLPMVVMLSTRIETILYVMVIQFTSRAELLEASICQRPKGYINCCAFRCSLSSVPCRLCPKQRLRLRGSYFSSK